MSNSIMVQMTVHTEIEDPQGEKQEFSMQGTGSISIQGEAYVLVYQERQGEELTNTRVIFNEAENSVHLERTGSVQMNHMFIHGAQTQSIYKSPFGQFDYISKGIMVTHTIEDVDKQVWSIEFQLSLNGQEIGTYRITHIIGNVYSQSINNQIH